MNYFKNAKIIGEDVDNDEYQKHPAISRSSLKDFWDNPWAWKKGLPERESKGMSFGKLVDEALFYPAYCEDHYIEEPLEYENTKGEQKPWNYNADRCKEWRENVRIHRCEPISKSLKEDVEKAIGNIRMDALCAEILNKAKTQVMITAEVVIDGQTIPVKTLIDAVPMVAKDHVFSDIIADLKTARSIKTHVMEREVDKYWYHVQAAMCLDLWNAATGEKRYHFMLFGVKNVSPFPVFHKELDNDFIRCGRRDYKLALKKYAECLKSDKWPGEDGDMLGDLTCPSYLILRDYLPDRD